MRWKAYGIAHVSESTVLICSANVAMFDVGCQRESACMRLIVNTLRLHESH